MREFLINCFEARLVLLLSAAFCIGVAIVLAINALTWFFDGKDPF